MKASKKFFLALSMLVGVSAASCAQLVIEPPDPNSSTPTTNTSGGGSEQEQEIDLYLDSNVKVELSLVIPSGNENERTMIESAIQSFNLKFPNVTFKTNYVQVNNYESQIRNMNVAGQLPDILWTNSQELYFLRSLNVIQPLNPYFEASEKRGDFNFEEDFKTEFFDMAGDNGTYYAVPRSADTVVCFYNKKLLSDAGISMDTIKNGWTWDDFIALCREWREYADKQGHEKDWYCCDFNFGWTSVDYPVIRSFGGDYFNEDGSIAINSENVKNALTMMRGLVDDRLCVANGMSSGSSFQNGTAPFIFQSAAISHYDNLAVLKGNIDIVTFPIINGEQGRIGAGIAGYALTNAAGDQESEHDKNIVAYEFLNHLISYEGQQSMAEGGLNLPSVRNDLADPTNPDAKWAEGYTDRNLEAYILYDERKVADEFYRYIRPNQMANVTLTINDMIGDTLSNSPARYSIDEVIERTVSSLEDDLA